jgi:hypothetical protein
MRIVLIFQILNSFHSTNINREIELYYILYIALDFHDELGK